MSPTGNKWHAYAWSTDRNANPALLTLVAARSGHFRLESGHHTDRWLDLERLFIEPAMLGPFVEKLAGKLSAHRPDLICGPMTGGALLAELIATHLGTRFAFAQRTIENGRAQYSIAKSLRDVLNDQRVAVVDDAISAGSAVGGTVGDVVACGGHVIALGALMLVGRRAHELAARLQLPLEWLLQLETELWAADQCPLCRQGEPWEEP